MCFFQLISLLYFYSSRGIPPPQTRIINDRRTTTGRYCTRETLSDKTNLRIRNNTCIPRLCTSNIKLDRFRLFDVQNIIKNMNTFILLCFVFFCNNNILIKTIDFVNFVYVAISLRIPPIPYFFWRHMFGVYGKRLQTREK